MNPKGPEVAPSLAPHPVCVDWLLARGISLTPVSPVAGANSEAWVLSGPVCAWLGVQCLEKGDFFRNQDK